MNDLVKVFSKDGKVVVSSRVVAQDFGKQHKNVLQSIDSIIADINTSEFSDLFIESEYKASNGKMNKEYLLTRDGFSLLVMGFTGSEALQWKLKYIEAFNTMEQHLQAIADNSPEAFIKELKLKRYHIEKTFANFVTYKNVDELVPLLIARIESELPKKNRGTTKSTLYTSMMKVLKNKRDECQLSAQREIITHYIEMIQEKYNRVVITMKGGTSKSFKTKIIELENRITELENQSENTITKSDKEKMQKYRAAIVSNMAIYARQTNMSSDKCYRELYDIYYDEYDVEIYIEYKGKGSYLANIEEKGDIDVLRNLYSISKNMLF